MDWGGDAETNSLSALGSVTKFILRFSLNGTLGGLGEGSN